MTQAQDNDKDNDTKEERLPVAADGSAAAGPSNLSNLEALDDSRGASVVVIEFAAGSGAPVAFHAMPDWLRERFSREDVVAANPHNGVALYCCTCDLLLNGAQTGGACPICGERDPDRVIVLLAELDGDRS